MGYLLAKGDFSHYLCTVTKKTQGHENIIIAKTRRKKNRLKSVF